MGWDIHFHARFAQAMPPVRRFACAFMRINAQPGIEALRRFAMVRRPASGPDETIEVTGQPPHNAPADDQVVWRHLDAHLDEPDWLLEATWTWREAVFVDATGTGLPATVDDAITIAVPWQTYYLGARMSPDVLPPGGAPDLVVDAFDYRRYFPRDGDRAVPWHDLPPGAPAAQLARAKIDALMRRLAPIIDLGVVSLWGLQGEDRFSPDTIYAAFHRDPERYRDDGGPVLPDILISVDDVREAARRSDYLYVATPAGPIVYDARLGYGRLDGFYQSLRFALEAKGDQEALAALEREIEDETRDRK